MHYFITDDAALRIKQGFLHGDEALAMGRYTRIRALDILGTERNVLIRM